MSDIYVFGPKESENDYASMGLVGALEPEEVTFKETLNGDSLVTMKHPIDEFGAYLTLKEGNILVVPVPVRTTPEIQNGSCVTTVWTYKVKPLDQLTSQNQRTLYKAKTGSGRKKVLNAGEIVTVVQKLEDENARWKVKSEYGEGWINASADGPAGFELVTEHVIADNSQAIEEVQSPWSVMPQYFRIYEVKKSLDEFEVSARHISYDLLHNMTIYESENSTDLQTALKGVLENCLASHDFQAFTNVSNEQAGLFYKRRNPMDVFMNEEDGLCTRYDVCLVRDNYSLYLLHDPGLNRGVRIEYGKNMVGVEFDSSIDEVATRIVPVGEKKDGTDLYLSDDQNGRYIDSSKINSYPVLHVYELKCDNCKVGDKDENGGTVTVAVARARMKAQAEALLANGCDEPTITMSVEFVNLGDTLEYEQFKDLENCFLADYVIVQHPDLDIDITARIVEIEWDCLLNRMNSVTIGQVGKTLANTGITSWQIPSGISGAKIGSGTLGNAALKTDIIAAIHMQADSVNTGALQAGSVTAEKLAAQAITADKIKAGSITANEIASHTITADKIAAETITGDNIAAGAITAVKIAGKTITADQLMAGLITADCGLIDTGAIQTAQIADGSITAAKIVSLNADVINAGTIKAERLLIAGEDGLIYQINATSSGLSKTELSKDQYKQQINGTVIVAQSITAAQIAAATITGNEIAANAVKAGNIDVASLFADEIFTGSLYTSKIYGGKSLEIIVGDVSKAQETADNAATWRVEIISGGGQVLNGASSVTLSAHLYYGETEYTDRISEAAFSWRRSSDGDGENSDAVWATAHAGMKQITVTAGDADYNAVYTCDVDYKYIIDVDYEAFELSGNPVVCEPYADYPLDITAAWSPERVYGNANLLDFDGIILFENSDGCTLEIVGKTVVFGNYANANDRFVCSAWVDVEANTDYSVSCKSASIGQYYIYTDKLFGTLVKAVSNNAPTFNSGNNTRVLIGFYSIKTDRVGDVDTLSEFKVEQGTSVTTYIPYGASCNIVGRASVDVTRCGANILQYTPPASGTLNGIQWTVDGNRISISGTATASCYILLAGGYGGTKYGYPPMIAPGETYALSRYTQVYFYKKDGTSIAPRGTTFVAPPSEDVKTYGIFVSVFTADGAVDATIQPTIAVGAQSSLNEVAYTGETKTLVLPHEVYGGTVNADGSCTETWGSIESYAGETLPGEWMSDRGDTLSGTSSSTAVPATGAHVVYKLTTPVAMTATGGGEVAALDGVNTILTNADSLTVKGCTNERAVLA